MSIGSRWGFLMKRLVGAVLLICCCAGCDMPAELQMPAVKPLQAITELPAANLPESLRPHNWTDRGGSGSCVNASTVYNLHQTNQPAKADHWRRTYAGGETDSSIRRKLDNEGLQYYFTRQADPELLRWATDTRRSALIWYYQSHCVNFVGFHRDPSRPTDDTVYAWLCDNNRPQRYIRIPYDEFTRKWAGYGGFGLSLAAPPVPPPLFDALRSS